MAQPTSPNIVLEVPKRVSTGIFCVPTDIAHCVYVRSDTFYEHSCQWLIFAESHISIVPPSSLEFNFLIFRESSSKYYQGISPTDGLEIRSPALKRLPYGVIKCFLTEMINAFHQTMPSIVMVTISCQKAIVLESIMIICKKWLSRQTWNHPDEDCIVSVIFNQSDLVLLSTSLWFATVLATMVHSLSGIACDHTLTLGAKPVHLLSNTLTNLKIPLTRAWKRPGTTSSTLFEGCCFEVNGRNFVGPVCPHPSISIFMKAVELPLSSAITSMIASNVIMRRRPLSGMEYVDLSQLQTPV